MVGVERAARRRPITGGATSGPASAGPTYDARAFRCDFDLRDAAARAGVVEVEVVTAAGAAIDSFDGFVLRQKVTMAAATKTLE